MAERDRLGPQVRRWTRRLAGLMRTPDDGLEAYALDQDLPEGLDVAQLRLLRGLLDELAEGMEEPPGAAFWSRLDAVREALAGRSAPPPRPEPPVLSASPAPPPPRQAGELDRTAASPVLDASALRAGMPDDFRRELVGARPAAAPPAPAPADWRPRAPHVTPPADAQEQTLGDSGEDTLTDAGGDTLGFDEWEGQAQAEDPTTVKMRSVAGALQWSVEQAAAMTVVLAQHAATGQPTLDGICRQLDLPDRTALEIARRTWQRRLADDPELRRRHDALVRAWTER